MQKKIVADMQQTNDLITTFETSIAQYKNEYADLISAAQVIKTDFYHRSNRKLNDQLH